MSRTPAATTFKQISGQPLYQNVVQQIAQKIVSGALQPGATLPVEAELAQQFGVSRTVVREAVRVLVSKGLLSVKQGSGMRVQLPDEWNYLDPMVLFEQIRSGQGEDLLEETLEVRRILEVEVAALAAERQTEHDLILVKAVLEGMTQAISAPDRFTELDIEFHENILNAARNRLLREALRPVAETLRLGRFITIRLPGGAENSLRGHEEIYAALERRDVEGARSAMYRHVKQFEHDIHLSLRPRGPDEAP